ncbi:Replication factor C small subunit 2 [Frankliniella fusca]|uniref:Replication factor C small subunit 2 n=1 Tax=Frankliniella fusca TaxID=407009 RepID=A0AAE1H981_9NEOP|nr:Replication factor C small subunit 2 [Frankliniella fusca]
MDLYEERVRELVCCAAGRSARFKPWCVCLLVCAVCLALIFAIAMPLTLRGARSLATHQDRLDLVRRLLKEVPLIDG